jgi:sigma-B regulation protein RsbU (phosphoserine phosphatase)
VIGSDGVKAALKPTGPAVGAFPDLEFKAAHIRIAAGEAVFAFTDGATDAQNPGGEFFTRERLIRAAAAFEPDAERVVERILAAIESHMGGAPPFDDVTVLVALQGPNAADGRGATDPEHGG